MKNIKSEYHLEYPPKSQQKQAQIKKWVADLNLYIFAINRIQKKEIALECISRVINWTCRLGELFVGKSTPNHLVTRSKPDSRQDWAKMTDKAAEGSNYADVYRVPPMNNRNWVLQKNEKASAWSPYAAFSRKNNHK